jgi:hypothetical protein
MTHLLRQAWGQFPMKYIVEKQAGRNSYSVRKEENGKKDN